MPAEILSLEDYRTRLLEEGPPLHVGQVRVTPDKHVQLDLGELGTLELNERTAIVVAYRIIQAVREIQGDDEIWEDR